MNFGQNTINYVSKEFKMILRLDSDIDNDTQITRFLKKSQLPFIC